MTTTFHRKAFAEPLGRIAPHVDNAVTSFASAFGLAPVLRRDQPPRALWQAGDETMVEFVYRAPGPSDLLVHDIGLLGELEDTAIAAAPSATRVRSSVTFDVFARTVGAQDQPMANSTTRVAYLMPRPEASTRAELRRTVELAEAADLDGLGLGDHVSFHVGAGTDALVGAASVLAASERLSAVIGVYLLPLRHPVVVARQLTDIATLAPGRLVLGVGIGGEDPHEFEICGVDPRTRGRRTDECLTVIRALLRGETVDFDGEFFHLENAIVRPEVAEPVAILVGGRSDAAIRRAARHGDGWFGIWVSASRYAQAIEQMQAAASEAGREPVQWHNALNVWCGIGSQGDEARGYVASAMESFYGIPYERFEKWSPAGSPEHIAEFLAPYVEAGCHTFNVIACGESVEAEIAAVGEIRKRLG